MIERKKSQNGLVVELGGRKEPQALRDNVVVGDHDLWLISDIDDLCYEMYVEGPTAVWESGRTTTETKYSAYFAILCSLGYLPAHGFVQSSPPCWIR